MHLTMEQLCTEPRNLQLSMHEKIAREFLSEPSHLPQNGF